MPVVDAAVTQNPQCSFVTHESQLVYAEHGLLAWMPPSNATGSAGVEPLKGVNDG